MLQRGPDAASYQGTNRYATLADYFHVLGVLIFVPVFLRIVCGQSLETTAMIAVSVDSVFQGA